MNRAKPSISILRAFFFTFLLSALTMIALGQNNASLPRPTDRATRLKTARSVAQHHVYHANDDHIAPEFTLRRFTLPGHRAPGDGGVVRQTVPLSLQNPANQGSLTTSAAQDEHPFFTDEESLVYFDSNRTNTITATDPGGTNPPDLANPTAGTYNIYSESPDGTGVAQITTGTDNKLDPAISHDGTQMAYVSGGTIVFDTNPASPTYLNSITNGFNLYVLNVSTGGTPTALTINSNQFSFADVRHPSWQHGASLIAFAGKLTGASVYHIFMVDASSGTLTQLTTGASNDYAPSWSPDGTLIAFTSNGTNFSRNYPLSASGKNGYDNIWVMYQQSTNADPRQVTGLPGATSSNKNPAWSALRNDPKGVISSTSGSPRQMLAFASNRGGGGTFSIYYMTATIGADPLAQGALTVTTPESTGNAALLLQTSTPTGINVGGGIDPTDPSVAFNPGNKWNLDYPAWPQYQNSYRMVFQSNRGGNLNLWASTILDLNAPTLLKYDSANNQVVGIYEDNGTAIAPSSTNYVREIHAGDAVRFRVRAADYETGINSGANGTPGVYLQIKDPSSKPQSTDHQEHKIFYIGHGGVDNNTVVNAPYEADCQAFNPNNGSYAFPTPGVASQDFQFAFGSIGANWPGTNLYVAGFSDVEAFSGASKPPDTNNWLPLYDDGPRSKGGHEPEGEVAGDGVFTNSWKTPSFASDFYIDVILRDQAVDPFDTTGALAVNWKIYDNVWGFTSQHFQKNGQILYVNDYDCGQRFFDFHNGIAQFSFAGTPTESWMTEYDSALFPTNSFSGTTANKFIHTETPLGWHSYGTYIGLTPEMSALYDPLVDDGARNSDAAGGETDNIGSINPVTGRYDQWRILSRGPLPATVLNLYLPLKVQQPADPIANTPAHTQYIANNAVIWHSPYSGDLFVGSGTIVDVNVQQQLKNFVQSGGRLFVNGQDIAWALSLGDQASSGANSFLTSVLHVAYVADFDLAEPWAQYNPAGNAPKTNPIANQTWANVPLTIHSDYIAALPLTSPYYNPPGTGNLYSYTLPGSTTTFYDWSATNQISPDVVSFNPPTGTGSTNGVDFRYGDGTGPGIMYYYDPNTMSGAPTRVVYSPMGFESISPGTIGRGTGFTGDRNLPTELIHNILDYLRTGRIYGQITTYGSGGQPIGGVFVRAIDTTVTPNVVAGTAYSNGSGIYTIDGLYPSGIYALEISKPGYIAQHLTGTYFHGGYQARLDIIMRQADPSSISGTVTDLTTGAPVAGARVVAIDPTNPNQNASNAPYAITDTNGNYTISNIPSSTNIGYIVRVTNFAALGYSGSKPPSYGGGEPGAGPAVIATTNTPAKGINFQLTPLPGIISGKITDSKTGVGIPGASVVATSSTTSSSTYTATADANGNYSIPNVPPGNYSVMASAIGYNPKTYANTVTVVTKQTVTVNIALDEIPPGSLGGRVQTSYGFAIAGATITVTDPNGKTIATVTTTGETSPAGGNNYTVPSVPAGATVTITAQKAGYLNYSTTPPAATVSTTLLVVSATNNQVPTLTLDPLHLFSPQLSLVSSPYDYTTPLAQLLGVPSDPLLFETWNGTSYVTPSPNTLQRGYGYFLADSNTSATLQLTSPGATDLNNFNITLKPGWNLIGDPFPFSLNFLGLNVVTASGTTVDIVSAQGSGLLGSALWSYQSGAYTVSYTLDPWLGYWIRAYQPLTLVVSASAELNRSLPLGNSTTRRDVLDISNTQSNSWKLDLVASAGNVHSAKSFVGVSPTATESYDRFKLESPPVIGNQNVSLAISHPDWGAKAGNYAVDVRSASAPTHTWNFTVTSNVAKTPVVLQWPSVATVPAKHDLLLTDLDTKTQINLRNQISYTVSPVAGVTTRHFSLVSQVASRQPLRVVNVAATVNGGGATSRAVSSVGISYTLTTDATMQVAILQNGRHIRTLDAGQTRSIGNNGLVWDLKDDQNRAVSGNTYTLEVRAVDKTGHMVRQVVPLLIPR